MDRQYYILSDEKRAADNLYENSCFNFMFSSLEIPVVVLLREVAKRELDLTHLFLILLACAMAKRVGASPF